MAIDPGEHVAGRFRLERELGRGGMASVWLATDDVLTAQCAVKFLDNNDDPELRQRFKREARAMARLRSPYIVQVLDFGEHKERSFIAMELLEGETLNKRLQAGPMSPGKTLDVARQLARGLAKVHDAGVVHRDLKPENVFLLRIDGEDHVKIFDFGVAKAPGDDIATRTGAFVGSPSYMSPEQVDGASGLDHRSDLWSLGVIVFECLVGERPFEGESLSELIHKIVDGPLPTPSARAAVPDGFDAWCRRALARDPAERFESVRMMVDELARALGETEATMVAADIPPNEATDLPHRMAASANDETVLDAAQNEPLPMLPKRRWFAGLIGLGVGIVGVVAWVWPRTPVPERAEPEEATALPSASEPSAAANDDVAIEVPPTPAASTSAVAAAPPRRRSPRRKLSTTTSSSAPAAPSVRVPIEKDHGF